MSELDEMIANSRDVSWLASNYGKVNTEQLGRLGTAGLITSHILEAIKMNLNDS